MNAQNKLNEDRFAYYVVCASHDLSTKQNLWLADSVTGNDLKIEGPSAFLTLVPF